MALFRKRTPSTSRRALRKAHTKQLKAQAAAEKKFRAKQDKSSAKDAARKATKARKAPPAQLEKVGDLPTAAKDVSDQVGKKVIKKANKARNKARTSTVRNYLGVAKLLTPVLAPLAYRGATQLRGQIETARARKLGVGVDQLSEFTGHGAALSARIDGIERALDELVAAHPDDSGFRDATTGRLAELSTAVHAAERMPTPRRRAAHQAVATDLDRVDADLLARLKVR
ncbi:MAG: DUF6474 family protein [Mycobacteriaceae bacterium]